MIEVHESVWRDEFWPLTEPVKVHVRTTTAGSFTFGNEKLEIDMYKIYKDAQVIERWP